MCVGSEDIPNHFELKAFVSNKVWHLLNSRLLNIFIIREKKREKPQTDFLSVSLTGENDENPERIRKTSCQIS